MTDSYKMLEQAGKLETKGKWKELLEHCQTWSQEYPSNWRARQGSGDALVGLGKPREAIEEFLIGIELAPTHLEEVDEPMFSPASIFFRLGNVYRELGENKNAIEAYLKAIEFDQNGSDLWNNLGATYMNMTPPDVGAAFEAFKKAVVSNPQNTNSLMNLGRVYAVCNMEEGVDHIYNRMRGIDYNLAKIFLAEAKNTMSTPN